MVDFCTAINNQNNTFNFQHDFQAMSLFTRATHKEKYSFPQVDRKDIVFSDERTASQKLMSVIRRATGFLTPSELEILQQYSPVSLTMDSKTPSGIPIFSDILKKEARQLGLCKNR